MSQKNKDAICMRIIQLLQSDGKKKYKEGGSVYIGSAIKTEYGGKKLSNKSYERYYKGMI